MTERLELRIKPEIKKIIILAADIVGLTLSDFVINASYIKAVKFINEYNEILEIINHEFK